jgi:23S rRNA-/tRNA-specific pseudouridylate synthase
MKSINHSILGDPLYGPKECLYQEDFLHLWAVEVVYQLPSNSFFFFII